MNIPAIANVAMMQRCSYCAIVLMNEFYNINALMVQR